MGGGGRNDGIVGAGTMEWDTCGNERGTLRWVWVGGAVDSCLRRNDGDGGRNDGMVVSVRMVGVEVSGSRPAPG